jgi:hypothetical protein
MVDKPTVVGGGSQKPEESVDSSSPIGPGVVVAWVAAPGPLAGSVHSSSGSVAGLLGGLGELEFCEATPSSAVPSDGTSLKVV